MLQFTERLISFNSHFSSAKQISRTQVEAREMELEETEKSMATNTMEEEQQEKGEREGDGEQLDLEEGEIVNEKPNKAITMASAHPLENSWTFWFHNPTPKSKRAAWGSSIRPIYTFSTAEDFWSLYNNIDHPSKLRVGADFHCFKYKIEPKWEDPVCANGGKWKVTFPKWKSDTCWLYTLLAMIGEQFDHGDEICGAVVNVRAKVERIALWSKNAANAAAQLTIGKQWKKFLDYNETIGFIFHDDAKKLGRGANNRYTC